MFGAGRKPNAAEPPNSGLAEAAAAPDNDTACQAS